MDEQEAVWLASVHLREWLGGNAENWQPRPEVEKREQGWVVCFRHTGHFAPKDRPRDRCFYVFRDGYVEAVTKHGPKFTEFRRQRLREDRSV
jgi:hypothetical protein